ncbi:hypothetical protein IWQ47_005165 [Aquimarina sp. EL_43]|uniref:hypothetical protein n=1 Tax=unclassified Aquimarina TaxID=2627091 RepID=UPI0018C922B3|nr:MULTISPECIES: hypothetical protein [unclassified Aquimarina]MBG6133693.1 hypothetical protein [Aquimarina sp. EL_35]MBG6153836.1 hypothetical protein [Aquimarina sp. EL_32]MBG6172066.1 hypothetical protein [Aquimarina sp. EL_43]
MKRILIVLTLLTGIPITGNAQSHINYEEMVGFGCAFGGEPSKSVKKVSKLIDKEKYDKIVKLLDSDNNAERFLAVVVCEKLSELKKLAISDELKDKISIIYKSNAFVSVCSGCTYWDNLTLKKMLESENSMRISANYWLEHKFKTK